jgi:hypothetical protein
MDIQLKEVTNRRDLRQFILFPRSLYKGNPYFVPALFMDDSNTLRWDKNPAFKDCKTKYWLAVREGQIVGRVAAILPSKFYAKWGKNYMRFGWLDFIDDPAVSAALIGAVEDWAKAEGMEAVHGPLGFTDLDREGMLVEGFEELGTMATNYNYPYYPRHLEALGYAKDTDWVEYEISVPDEPNEKITKAAELVMKRNNLHVLPAKRTKDFLPYAKDLFAVLEEAYRHLYGVMPLSEEQVQSYIDQYFGLAVAEYVPLVMDEKNKLVAFGIVFPSFSKALQKSGGDLFPFGFIHLLLAMKHNDRADMYLVGVKDEYLGKGVNAILMNQIQLAFIKNGVKKVESNPELEDNQNVQTQWKYFEKRQHRRRRCFIKKIV